MHLDPNQMSIVHVVSPIRKVGTQLKPVAKDVGESCARNGLRLPMAPYCGLPVRRKTGLEILGLLASCPKGGSQ